ncbi:MAG TPA: transporter substrate-binding domain-containing protein [Bryobacteraceae bacterium]|jgi:polar amino acid transport system substrate-binding protein|nr:transporter substrate-binding domain-containing protein [Bryobacteraceae bacterium]
MIPRIFLVALACTVVWGQGLAPTGTLRAIFLQNNPVQGRVDAKTRTVTGPAADLTRELGREAGVPVTITGVAGVRQLIESLKSHTADIGFLAFDESRAAEVDFSRVYLLSWSGYIVRADSGLKTLEDVDRAGVRVGSARGDSPEIYLTKALKNAELKRYENPPAAHVVELLRSREIDIWAANRQRLIEMAAGASDLRVLAGNYTGVRQAIAVAKGNAAAVGAINRLLMKARDAGLIQAAIERAGLTASAGVAP